MESTLHRVIVGRFNPPHVGHERMLERASDKSNKFGMDYVVTKILISPKEGTPNNPLTYSDRLTALRTMADKCSIEDGIILPFYDGGLYGVLKNIFPRTKNDTIQFIGGSDRIGEYADRFFKLRGHPEMHPLLSEVDAVFTEVPRENALFSSTFARNMAASGFRKYFASVMPKSLDENTIKYLYEQTRKGILQNDNKGSD